MYIDKTTYNQIQEITMQDYEGIEREKQILLPTDMLLCIIEDLLVEYHKKEEELEDIKNKEYDEPDYFKIWRDNNACR